MKGKMIESVALFVQKRGKARRLRCALTRKKERKKEEKKNEGENNLIRQC